MGLRYDKDRFVKNIYFLAKNQGVKIGELEAVCEVSAGYFARLRQGGESGGEDDEGKECSFHGSILYFNRLSALFL